MYVYTYILLSELYSYVAVVYKTLPSQRILNERNHHHNRAQGRVAHPADPEEGLETTRNSPETQRCTTQKVV